MNGYMHSLHSEDNISLYSQNNIHYNYYNYINIRELKEWVRVTRIVTLMVFI